MRHRLRNQGYSVRGTERRIVQNGTHQMGEVPVWLFKWQVACHVEPKLRVGGEACEVIEVLLPHCFLWVRQTKLLVERNHGTEPPPTQR
jgi:hypothetical protein